MNRNADPWSTITELPSDIARRQRLNDAEEQRIRLIESDPSIMAYIKGYPGVDTAEALNSYDTQAGYKERSNPGIADNTRWYDDRNYADPSKNEAMPSNHPRFYRTNSFEGSREGYQPSGEQRRTQNATAGQFGLFSEIMPMVPGMLPPGGGGPAIVENNRDMPLTPQQNYETLFPKQKQPLTFQQGEENLPPGQLPRLAELLELFRKLQLSSGGLSPYRAPWNGPRR